MWPLVQSFLVIFAAFLLQMAVVPHLDIGGVKPDVVLIVTALYGFAYGSQIGAMAGFTGGFLVDLVNGQIVGIGLLTKSLVGFFAGMVRRAIFVENIILPMLAIFAATIINDLIYSGFIFLFGEATPLKPLLIGTILPQALYNAVLTPLIYLLVHRFLEFKQEDPSIRIASKAG